MQAGRRAGGGLAIAAVAAAAGVVIVAIRLRPEPPHSTAPDGGSERGHASGSARRPPIENRHGEGRPSANANASRARGRTPTAGSTPAGEPPKDDVAYPRWLEQIPQDVLRGELADLARRVPGVSLLSVECRDRPCQAGVQAATPAAFDDLLKLVHERYRGYILFTASVDHPGAPARVAGSIHIGAAEKLAEATLGYPR